MNIIETEAPGKVRVLSWLQVVVNTVCAKKPSELLIFGQSSDLFVFDANLQQGTVSVDWAPNLLTESNQLSSWTTKRDSRYMDSFFEVLL